MVRLASGAVVHDASIIRSLDTYLRFRARPFDVDPVAPQPQEADNQLARRMFMLALRLCASHSDARRQKQRPFSAAYIHSQCCLMSVSLLYQSCSSAPGIHNVALT